MMDGPEKSDSVIVAVKPPNKSGRPGAEAVEPRAGTKRNATQQSTHRTQGRVSVSQALIRVRQAAKLQKKGKFTALFHHLNTDLLREAFFALKRDAAPGADGLRWEDYEADLEPGSLICTIGSRRAAIALNRRGVGTSPKQMADNARSLWRRWRTRSSTRLRPRC